MYVNVYVPKSGGSVVPKSDVYKCSDPYAHALCPGRQKRRHFRIAALCVRPHERHKNGPHGSRRTRSRSVACRNHKPLPVTRMGTYHPKCVGKTKIMDGTLLPRQTHVTNLARHVDDDDDAGRKRPALSPSPLPVFSQISGSLVAPAAVAAAAAAAATAVVCGGRGGRGGHGQRREDVE